MPRPIRIEYENAFYHVMNRGRSRQMIFHDQRYYEAFLNTLAETSHRFQSIIHAYCLMGNHYPILISTPKANLGRIMRHVNGVYTQRYRGYKKYVLSGNDGEIEKFYAGGQLSAILGPQEFKRWVRETLLPEMELEKKTRILNPELSMKHIVKQVALRYETAESELRAVRKGIQPKNDARRIAIYLCQELASAAQKDIAAYFGMGHSRSVSYIIHAVKKQKQVDKSFAQKLAALVDTIIEQDHVE